MATQSEIVGALAEAQRVYSAKVKDWEIGLDLGVSKGHSKIFNLMELMLAIEYQIAKGYFTDSTTQKLYLCLIKEISYIPVVVPMTTVYVAFLETKQLLTEQQILALPRKVVYPAGGEYNLPTSNDYAYVGFYERAVEPVKTNWQDTTNTFNKGLIGTPDDLWGQPSIIGGYRGYITEYPTILSNPIKIKK